MASFGDEEDSMSLSLYNTVQGSQPLKRIESSVQKFTKIIIPTDLERLRQHKANIEKFHRHKDWGRLNTEQVNARLTVQQLMANIRDMEKTRSLIIETDLPTFDSRVSPVKEEAIKAVTSFLEIHDTEQWPLGVAQQVTPGLETESDLRQRQKKEISEDFQIIDVDGTMENHVSDEEDATTPHSESPKEAELAHLMLQQVNKQSQASLNSWLSLQNDLVSLNTLVHGFATYVRVQGETVDTITDNIDVADQHVAKGRKHLIQVSTIKAALLPVSGAIIGGCVGGPIGLYVGFKVGTATAIGGSLLGFVGGKLLKKHKDKKASLELEDMNREESDSVCQRRASDPGQRKKSR